MNSKPIAGAGVRTSSISDIVECILSNNEEGGINGIFINCDLSNSSGFKNEILYQHFNQLINTCLFRIIATKNDVLSASALSFSKKLNFTIEASATFSDRDLMPFIKNGGVVVHKKNLINFSNFYKIISEKTRDCVMIILQPKDAKITPIVYNFPLETLLYNPDQPNMILQHVEKIQKHPLQNNSIHLSNSSEFIRILNISVQNTIILRSPYVSEEDVGTNIISRPWGQINILSEHSMSSIRKLSLSPNKRLSLQRHVCRDELFISQDNGVMVDLYYKDLSLGETPTNEELVTKILHKGEQILIPRGTWHRLKAPSTKISVIEIAYGTYDQIHDIERREDDYGRLNKDGGF